MSLSLLTNPDGFTRIASIFASGTFFGLTLSTSTCIIPVLLSKHIVDPGERLRAWAHQFDLCARRWSMVSSASMILSTIAAFAYSTNGDRRLLLVNSVSFFAQFVLTFAAIFPVKDKLKAQLAKGAPYNDEEAKRLIVKWERLHRYRIIGSGIAFAAGLVELVKFIGVSSSI